MTHDEARVLLPSYAVGALDMAVAVTVRAHLATGCRECLHGVFGPPTQERHARPPSGAAVHTAPAVAVVAVPAKPLLVAPRTTAPPTERNGWLLASAAGIVVLVGFAAWATSQIGLRDARSADELRRLSARVAELEPMRADLADRLSKATHELDELRNHDNNERHQEATVAANLMRPQSAASAGSPETQAEPTESSKPTWVIRFANNALSVRVVDVSLAEILDEVSRQSGLTIRGPLAERVVSDNFESLKLPKALRRLLRDQNFVLAYDAQHRPRVLNLFAAAAAAPSNTTAVAPARKSEPPARPIAIQSAASGSGRRSSRRIREKFGMNTMSLPQLIDTGVRHENRRVRAEAWRAMIESLQADPELRAAGSTALGDFVRDVARDRADEALFYAATEAHEGRLRHKAAALWQQLRDQPAAPADPQPADD